MRAISIIEDNLVSVPSPLGESDNGLGRVYRVQDEVADGS